VRRFAEAAPGGASGRDAAALAHETRYDANDTIREVAIHVLPVTRIDHVSFATHSIDDSLRWFQALFGAREVRRMPVPAEGYTFAELELPNSQVGFELIEPLGDGSFVARFLEERGPGFHHITIEVENVDAAAAAMRAQGIHPFGGVRGSGHWRQTFIHPRDSKGILIQLVQAGE
jgi:methylmalonyl-CoA/ethylmalonyl-CoA epimerase